MTNSIESFSYGTAWLSNFYKIPVEYKGVVYANNECAFQAQKDVTRCEDFVNLEPKEAKKLGRRVNLRSDWEEVKDEIMYEICYNKFTQNEELKAKLLATGDAFLKEGNYWHDNHFGDCYCKKCQDKIGKNILGKILMRLREELRG